MKSDERMLLIRIAWNSHQRTVREIIAGEHINRKRASYILQKWIRKGWYDYGVSLDLGWLTEEGLKEAIK